MIPLCDHDKICLLPAYLKGDCPDQMSGQSLCSSPRKHLECKDFKEVKDFKIVNCAFLIMHSNPYNIQFCDYALHFIQIPIHNLNEISKIL